eukprot:6197536-Pleurochrysis_carterae.AAC.9
MAHACPTVYALHKVVQPNAAGNYVHGMIKSKSRNGLTHETSDKLVYCHEALHLHQNLQNVY